MFSDLVVDHFERWLDDFLAAHHVGSCRRLQYNITAYGVCREQAEQFFLR
jgi:hypothetical protein